MTFEDRCRCPYDFCFPLNLLRCQMLITNIIIVIIALRTIKMPNFDYYSNGIGDVQLGRLLSACLV